MPAFKQYKPEHLDKVIQRIQRPTKSAMLRTGHCEPAAADTAASGAATERRDKKEGEEGEEETGDSEQQKPPIDQVQY